MRFMIKLRLKSDHECMRRSGFSFVIIYDISEIAEKLAMID